MDDQYDLEEQGETYFFWVRPRDGVVPATLDTLQFFANCLSFEHDLPAFVASDGTSLGLWPVRPLQTVRPWDRERDLVDSIADAFEHVNSVRLGGLAYVRLQWDGYERPARMPFTTRFQAVEKELALYAAALRQFDPLAEFLGYYRVIESVSGDNGKSWVSAHLDLLGKFDYGFVEINDEQHHPHPARRANLLAAYRRRAMSRLRELDALVVRAQVPSYLWATARCGIAHGKTGVRVCDFGRSLRVVARDSYLVKMLARMAIMETGKIRPLTRLSPHPRCLRESPPAAWSIDFDLGDDRSQGR